MNLYEEKRDTNNFESNSKKTIKILVISLVFVVIAIVVLMAVIYSIEEKQFKVNINGQRAKLPADTFIFEGNNIYVSIKDFAQDTGYTYHNGEYKHQYSEDADKCYIYNNNEIASFSLDSDTLYKVLNSNSQTSEDESDYEYFSIDEKKKKINNKLYTTLEGISKGCNVSIAFDQQKNSLNIFTLDYLTTFYAGRIPTSIFVEGASQSEENYFSNQKAILYNLMVVKDANEHYGVYDLNGNTIIGEKYKSIKFIESSQEFIVKTDNDKMGIIANDATTKIEPNYDSIKQIDKDLDIYLVSNNDKFGVINGNGRTVIFLEYTKIGVDANQFSDDNIKNPYLLYNRCIPVCQNDKWGMMDVNGNTILPVEYNGFGCIAKSGTSSNLLLVPEYQAFVVQQNNYYGLYNVSGNELIPIRVTNMYTVISSGKKGYYLTYEGVIMDVIDYLSNTLGIKPIADENGEILQVDSNTDNNVTNTQNQNTQNQVDQQSNQISNTQVTNSQTDINENNQITNSLSDNNVITNIQTNMSQETNTQSTTVSQTNNNQTIELEGINE